MRHLADLGTLVVANGAAISSSYDYTVPGAIPAMGAAVDYQIEAPATLTSATWTVEITSNKAPAAGDWRTLIVGGAAVGGAADQSVTVPAVGFKGIRVATAGNETGAKTFRLMAQMDMAY